MVDPVRLVAKGAFDALLKPLGPGGGVTVAPRDELDLARIVARDMPAVRRALRDAFGVEAPDGPRRIVANDVALVGVGPRAWLATAARGDESLAEKLRCVLAASAAVVDQSSALAVLRIGGPKARATFEKGLMIDLHPRAFRVGDAAVTLWGQIAVTIWQVDEKPAYEVALPRSYAASFCAWLADSAGGFGLAVETA